MPATMAGVMAFRAAGRFRVIQTAASRTSTRTLESTDAFKGFLRLLTLESLNHIVSHNVDYKEILASVTRPAWLVAPQPIPREDRMEQVYIAGHGMTYFDRKLDKTNQPRTGAEMGRASRRERVV